MVVNLHPCGHEPSTDELSVEKRVTDPLLARSFESVAGQYSRRIVDRQPPFSTPLRERVFQPEVQHQRTHFSARAVRAWCAQAYRQAIYSTDALRQAGIAEPQPVSCRPATRVSMISKTSRSCAGCIVAAIGIGL